MVRYWDAILFSPPPSNTAQKDIQRKTTLRSPSTFNIQMASFVSTATGNNFLPSEQVFARVLRCNQQVYVIRCMLQIFFKQAHLICREKYYRQNQRSRIPTLVEVGLARMHAAREVIMCAYFCIAKCNGKALFDEVLVSTTLYTVQSRVSTRCTLHRQGGHLTNLLIL